MAENLQSKVLLVSRTLLEVTSAAISFKVSEHNEFTGARRD
jgi:hypothetical protein